MKYKRFEDLPVWNAAIDFAVEVYALTGKEEFKKVVLPWFESAGKPPENMTHVANHISLRNDLQQTALVDQNFDIIKGLVWFASMIDEAAILRAISDLGAVCYKKIPDLG